MLFSGCASIKKSRARRNQCLLSVHVYYRPEDVSYDYRVVAELTSYERKPQEAALDLKMQACKMGAKGVIVGERTTERRRGRDPDIYPGEAIAPK